MIFPTYLSELIQYKYLQFNVIANYAVHVNIMMRYNNMIIQLYLLYMEFHANLKLTLV